MPMDRPKFPSIRPKSSKNVEKSAICGVLAAVFGCLLPVSATGNAQKIPAKRHFLTS
jgi:hypothetical protein